MQPIPHPSPNFGERRDGLRPGLVVLHYTAMADAPAALERLCSPEFEVSAHYLIARDGTLFQLVEEDKRAWHAGGGDWQGRGDVNSRSIGIELDNPGDEPFPQPLMQTLETLLPGIMARWDIPPEGVIGHSDMAPTRKFDPGRRFDWARLARQGLAAWPMATGAARAAVAPDETAFLRAAESFGYDVFWGIDPVLSAFRQRFRPWANGPLDPEDMGAMLDLAARFPPTFPIDPSAPTA